MSTLTSKELARRYLAAGAAGQFAAWDAWCAPQMVFRSGLAPPVAGLAAVKAFHEGLQGAFADFFWRVEDLLEEGNRVAGFWVMGGIQVGALPSLFGPIPPSNQLIAISGISLWQIREGKLVEERAVFDLLTALGQAGRLPARTLFPPR